MFVDRYPHDFALCHSPVRQSTEFDGGQVTNLTRRFPERIRMSQVRKERRRRRADEAARAAEEAERDVDLQIEEHIRQLELVAMAAADARPLAADCGNTEDMMQALLAETATSA
ncbi:unnamed protein product [Prorocentrum cordatum]|uniref:Uncharacterized protein n=1 Tax=Prorocentrum cordatum TaxID=2364126 RepID=A0ABN9S2B5_9DINO|nr:unnamed protein product [Polarella glacialis]